MGQKWRYKTPLDTTLIILNQDKAGSGPMIGHLSRLYILDQILRPNFIKKITWSDKSQLRIRRKILKPVNHGDSMI